MSTNLTKYLSGVFRNEIQDKTSLEPREGQSKIDDLNDPKMHQFLLDDKYDLRLDEII